MLGFDVQRQYCGTDKVESVVEKRGANVAWKLQAYSHAAHPLQTFQQHIVLESSGDINQGAVY